ncbi:MAG: helicase HerA-like domain-containing protein [Thermomicrobiales bacterium]
MTNRHGLVAGATGTGKTVTIHAMATKFSEIGVPVFLADVKGDLAGISQPGGDNEKVTERIATLGLTDFAYTGFPVTFWDVFGQQGHPVRATVSEMGPLLLSRLLNLNDTQNGVLTLVFKYADDHGLLLLDLKDLRALLQFVGENRKALTTEYGTVAPASIGAIQRNLLRLEEGGGDGLFGEPALELTDLMRTNSDGEGMINILAADLLMRSPTVYATFLLWLLSELFEQMPEAGDVDKPKLVFFFDEAHLLFNDAPEALQDKIEQVIRLIRSKGIGVFFVSQNPLDVPDIVLGQLGNRVQHALRAYTPRDQKAVRAAAETFRTNPKLDVEQAITQLEVGEALTSFLDPKGAPGIVERAYVIPPKSLIGAITPEQRAAIVNASPVRGKYEQPVDRSSAYEMLKQKAAETAAAAEETVAAARAADADASWGQAAAREGRKSRSTSRRRQDSPEAMLQDVAESAARSFGSQIGRGLVRGLLGSLTGRRR